MSSSAPATEFLQEEVFKDSEALAQAAQRGVQAAQVRLEGL